MIRYLPFRILTLQPSTKSGVQRYAVGMDFGVLRLDSVSSVSDDEAIASLIQDYSLADTNVIEVEFMAAYAYYTITDGKLNSPAYRGKTS